MTRKMNKKEFENMMVALFEEHPEYLEDEVIFDKITDEYWDLYGSDNSSATKEYPVTYPAYVCLA